MKRPVDKLELGPAQPTEEVAYWRVSTGRDQSPDMQIAAFARRGIPDGNVFGDTMSGRKAKRPGLAKALKLMEGRPGWTLVVWKLDRLGRDAYELMRLSKEFEEKGWNLVSITEGIDTRTAMGRAFYGLLAVFAQFESDVNAERSAEGMRRARQAGSIIGRKSALSREKWLKLEKDILSKRAHPLTINRLARRYKVSAGAINHHFPGWRSKSDKERRAWRKQHPLPH